MSDDRTTSKYPAHLRGMVTNRWGGNVLQHERGLKGGTYGAASRVRRPSKSDWADCEKRLREQGFLKPPKK